MPLRLPALIGATVLLHYLAIGWVGGKIGLPQVAQPVNEPIAIVAQLHAPPVEAAAPARHASPPVRKRRAAPAPAAPAEETAPAAQGETAPVAEAPPEQAPADSLVAGQAEPEEKPAEPPAAPLPRLYRAAVPPSSELVLELERVDANGAVWHGVAEMSWQLKDASYTMKFEAGISMIVTRLNLLSLASEGSVGEQGFAPRRLLEKRRGRAQTATHFNREQGTITFSASQNAFPLEPGAQDRATLPLQLAAIARADPAQFDDGIDIVVGEERAATVYRFVVAGQEEIETRLGNLPTLHLVRPPKPGSYNSRLDVWLAPERGWYPVRIRHTESSGAVTTQTVMQIVVRDSGAANEQ